MNKFDVIVAGGGFAGVAAALAASRGGAKVLLVEKSNSLGGAAVNCLVNPFMPYKTKINGKSVSLSAGIFKEIHRELEKRGAMKGESFYEEELKNVLTDMALESGVKLLFRTAITGVEKDGDKITSVRLSSLGNEFTVPANYFIDASGDANLAYMAGCPTRLGREPDNLCQPMTLCFRVGNIDVDRFMKSKPRLQKRWKESLKKGELVNPREDILIFKTPAKNVLHFNTTRVVKMNPTDPWDVTEAEILARRQVKEVYEFMKKNAEGLEESYIAATASEIGVRESRMIVGEYVLTEADCKATTKFEDGIAACNYDIDIHNPEGSGTSHYYFGDGEYYTIPYRSLLPKGVSNLLVAGRCISSDHGAQASYRIMPVVCCIGEAAGTAAAIAQSLGVKAADVPVDELVETLKANGAFI